MRLSVKTGHPIKLEMNINESVTVVLNEKGRIIWNGSGEGSYKPMIGDNWILSTQLWILMKVFGPHLKMGTSPFFVDNEITVEFR